MVAERVRIATQRRQDTPSNFIEGDIGLSEDLVGGKLSPHQAAERLCEIWCEFELSHRDPADVKRRSSALRELGGLLSSAAGEYLDEEVEVVRSGRAVLISRGLLIKERATDAARETLRTRRALVTAAKDAAAKMSASQKLEVRRQKANTRRGTRPELIH